jgi:ring-1,2-phenylacetyl-CoA epoxidase subunit PaaD
MTGSISLIGDCRVTEGVRHRLAAVEDPELPFLSIEELGILREICVDPAGDVRVTITPTYTGCPALETIRTEIARALGAAGYERIAVEVTLTPPWTTAWLSAAARDKLRKHGIAPPASVDSELAVLCGAAGSTGSTVLCPYCGTDETTCISPFGSTRCKALHSCGRCLEPFEEFKCI